LVCLNADQIHLSIIMHSEPPARSSIFCASDDFTLMRLSTERGRLACARGFREERDPAAFLDNAASGRLFALLPIESIPDFLFGKN